MSAFVGSHHHLRLKEVKEVAELPEPSRDQAARPMCGLCREPSRPPKVQDGMHCGARGGVAGGENPDDGPAAEVAPFP